MRPVSVPCILLAGCLVAPEHEPGETLWTRTHDGAGMGVDRALDIVADGGGVVVVAVGGSEEAVVVEVAVVHVVVDELVVFEAAVVASEVATAP